MQKIINRVFALSFAAISLIFCAGLTMAQTVERDGENASGITGLTINGVNYDVSFCNASTIETYGDDPTVFDFTTPVLALVALQAVVDTLTAEGGIRTVGNEGGSAECLGFPPTEPVFNIGWDTEIIDVPFFGKQEVTWVVEGYTEDYLEGGSSSDVWVVGANPESGQPVPDVYPIGDAVIFAKFTVAEPPPAESIPIDVTDVTDIDNDAMPDVALLEYKGDPRVRYFSGQSRQAINSVKYFSASWFPVAAATVTDADSNGVANDPAVAMLATGSSTGKHTVEVRRADTGTLINQINFLGTDWQIIDVAVINDKNGDGVSGDTVIAVLGVNPGLGDEWIKVEVRKLSDGSRIATLTFLNGSWTPLALEAVDRVGQTPLLAVLANKTSTGNNTIQARKLNNGAVHRDTAIWDNRWLARDIAILKDANGDGNANDPAYLVLANDVDSRNKVQGKRVSDGENLKNIHMMADVWNAHRVTTIGDLSGNLIEEVGALGEKSTDGKIAIQLVDFGDATGTATIFP